MIWLAVIIGLLVIGAVSGPRTLIHAFALGLDCFAQTLIWDDPRGITISARCGLLQRKGVNWAARIINVIMMRRNHCQMAIEWDEARLNAGLAELHDKEN